MMSILRFRIFAGLFATLLAWSLASAQTYGDNGGEFSRTITGGEFVYTARHGDYLARITSRFSASDKMLAKQNKLVLNRVLRSGEKVRVNNRHVVPYANGKEIVINLPQRLLFRFSGSELNAAYPVGLGKQDWPTPTGKFSIVNRQEDKSWVVPKSIQEEMAREGKTVLTEVPPGPNNPLGSHWLGLSLPGIGIHGTNAPVSVYRNQGHGCIRMHPDDIEDMFLNVAVGTQGRIIYATVLMAKLDDGRIFLEVNQDIYKRGIDPMKVAHKMAADNGITGKIDWDKATQVIKNEDGIATEVTLRAGVKAAPK